MYKIYTKITHSRTGCGKQILRVMKITTFILFAALMQVSATGIAQRLTLVQKNATLKQVFSEINKQTGYTVIWSANEVNVNGEVSTDFNNTPLLEALDKCLENTNLTYSVENKTVVIRKKEPSLFEKLKTAIGVPVTVTGKVYDEVGQPMPGVTVREKQTSNVTTTDAKGNYSISVLDNNSVIVFTFVGYEAQELAAKDIPAGSVIILKASINNLKEVVINKGYYNERRALTTGDVAIVTSKEIEEQPVSDPIQALIGRVAGLEIEQTSGIPGAYAKIQIRGVNSIANGNDPLYIVDGVPFSSVSLTSNSIGGGALGSPSNSVSNSVGPNPNIGTTGLGSGNGLSPFNALNPSDIEDIQVLKDADATAIYGSRGANGVILITTKRGKAGATKVEVNASQGAGQIGHTLNFLNTQQYLTMRREGFRNDGASRFLVPQFARFFPDILLWDTTRNTDWQKVMLGNTAQYTNIQSNISGGNTNTQFMIGAGYNHQTTVFPGKYADEKGSMHFSLTHASSNQKFKVLLSASYVNDKDDIPNQDLTGQIVLPPDAPPLYKPDGSINWDIYQNTATFNNPLAYTLVHSTSVTNNLISNLNLSYELIPGLKLSSNFGYGHDEMNQNILHPANSVAPPNDNLPSNRIYQFATTGTETWIVEPQLNYNKKMSKGRFDVLLGATTEQSTQKELAETASGFASDALIENPSAASTFQLTGNSYSLYRYAAVYGRIGYNWEEKYLLNITARRDGSSHFGPGKQYGNFGAVGLGWIFSKEKFIENSLSFLSFGKLRGSYGLTGNDQITPYQYLSSYTSNSATYQGTTLLTPIQLANKNFSWETDKKLEIGLDMGFLKDRINFSASYYRNRTGNQLVGYPLPAITGFFNVEYNLPAVIQNSGFEFTLNTFNVKTKDFSWSTAGNVSFGPYNKLVSYPGLANSVYSNSYEIGKSINIYKGYEFTGINPQTGN